MARTTIRKGVKDGPARVEQSVHTPQKVNDNTIEKWWTIPEDRPKDIAGSITASLNFMVGRQRQRAYSYVVGMRLYGNSALFGFYGFSTSKLPAAYSWLNADVRYNLAQSVCDTITSKVTQDQPVPYFLTSGGDYKAQRKAKKLTKFISGVFDEAKIYEIAPQVFLDSSVLGDGIIHVYLNKKGRVRYERVLPFEMWVDEVEAMWGSPRTLHRIKQVDRQVLCKKFPDAEALILKADATIERGSSEPNFSDTVTVRESWHLPSGEGAGDGRHVISVQDGVIFDEEWDHDFFPFVKLPWSPRQVGYWGQSLIEQIQSIQREVNKLLWLIQRSFHLMGTYKVLVEASSKVVTEHLNADIGAIIKYQGTPPQYVTPSPIQPEIFQHYRQLKADAYEQAGVSMMAATAQKPAGLNSGEAIRTYADVQSDRFFSISKRYSNLFLDLARISLALVKEHGRKYSVKVKSGASVSKLDFSDVSIEEDSYVMKVYAISHLPEEPSGRLQTVTEWMQAGLITQRQGKRLLGYPDLETVEGLEQASEDYIHKCMDSILDDGKLISPEPLDNLQSAIEISLQTYQRAKTDGVEPEKLALLREYIQAVQSLAAPPQPPMQAGPAPVGPALAPGQGLPPSPMVPPQSVPAA